MDLWRPGQRLTADRMNSADLIGRLVFAAWRDASQQITSSDPGIAANALAWDNVGLDVLTGWTADHPTRWTAPTPGWYTISGGASFGGSSAGTQRGCTWRVNGNLPPGATSVSHASTSIASTTLTVDARDLAAQLDAGDYVELCPYQNSGSSLSTAGGSLRPYIAIYYAGPV